MVPEPSECNCNKRSRARKSLPRWFCGILQVRLVGPLFLELTALCLFLLPVNHSSYRQPLWVPDQGRCCPSLLPPLCRCFSWLLLFVAFLVIYLVFFVCFFFFFFAFCFSSSSECILSPRTGDGEVE